MPSQFPGRYRNELHAWFGRSGRRPPYRTYSDGYNQFICVLSSHEDDITTEGRGLRRAEAEEEAARNFVEKLQRSGRWIEGNASRPVTSLTQPVIAGPPPPETNPKTSLNIYLQNSLRVSNPGTYTSYPIDSGRFKCQLEIELLSGPMTFAAEGPSKTEAEKACARKALAELQRCRPPPKTNTSERPVQKWNSRRPEPKNPCSLLNEFLQQNAIVNARYNTSHQLSDGKFETSCTIDLKDHGYQLNRSAIGTSKSESKKKCAERLIDDLEKLKLIDAEELSRASAESDDVWSSSAKQVSDASVSLSGISDLFESTKEVNNGQILLVSQHIGKFRKTIGLKLGLSDADIDNCMYREDDPYEVNRRILRRWREKESRDATVGKLCSVLRDCKAYDAVQELHKQLRDAQ